MANGLEFAMPIPLRMDFDASSVRAAARRSKDGAQIWRLLALAAIYEGASRTEAADGGVTLKIEYLGIHHILARLSIRHRHTPLRRVDPTILRRALQCFASCVRCVAIANCLAHRKGAQR
jgi:hypothetical protein